MNAAPPSVVVMGASAGGVEALSTVIRGLPADLPAAVLVVLHLSAHLPSGLPAILQRASDLPVATAERNEPLRAGRVYVAPRDHHLMIENETVRLTRGPRECRMRPSVDVLFRSAAVACGPRTVGVVLSGALDDGTAGLWAVKDRGGAALTEDPDTAAHGSMPRSAAQHVAVDAMLPVERLAAEIVRQVDDTGRRVRRFGKAPSNALAVEAAIGLEGNALQLGVMSLGGVSPYTCPTCQGVLVQIEEGTIARFRCHTGHAHSLQSLLIALDESVDRRLWESLRAVEERLMLLRQATEAARRTGASDAAAHYAAQADAVERAVAPLRTLVFDVHQAEELPDAA